MMFNCYNVGDTDIDELSPYRDDGGKLVDVGYGCYTTIYVCGNSDVLCADCAQRAIDTAKENGYGGSELPVTAFSAADTDDCFVCDNCDRVLSEGSEDDN